MSNTNPGKKPVKIEISDSLRAKLEEIRVEVHPNTRIFTAEEDALLLEYWESPDYRKSDIARILKTSTNTALKRYRYLTGQGS